MQSPESSAAQIRFVWCGKQEPHRRHEWLKGARRMDCPGIEESSAAYTLVEAEALHEVGVRNHGWYMTEAEHRGVLDVLKRLEAALRRIERLSRPTGGLGRVEYGTLDQASEIAREALNV